MTKEAQRVRDHRLDPYSLASFPFWEAGVFTPTAVAWRFQSPMLLGGRHSAEGGGQGATMRCGLGLHPWVSPPSSAISACEQAPGEWVVESSQATSHRAQVAFSREAPSLPLPRLGTASRNDVRIPRSHMFVNGSNRRRTRNGDMKSDESRRRQRESSRNGCQAGNTFNTTNNTTWGSVANF